MITLHGQLEKITFYNEENHYTIAHLRSQPPTASLITIVGYLAGASPGEYLKLKGTWETHPRYGQQFKIESFEITLPATIGGIKKYLSSGIIKGIGSKMAARLVNHFKEETLEIIEKTPERLREIDGIGQAKAARIMEAWKSHHAVRLLIRFLQEHEINASCSAILLKTYGTDAVEIISNNPYRIAQDVPAAGFAMADTIARKMDFPKDDPKRIHACILHLLEQSVAEGHTFQYETPLVERCAKLIRINPLLIREALKSLAETGKIVIEDSAGEADAKELQRCIYLKELYTAETGIAGRLRAMVSVPINPPSLDPDQITEEVLKKLAIKLSTEQLEALEEILLHRVVIITGGPGTGKTTLIRSITAIFKRLGKQILLAAPTGRAARRLSEVTRRKAATIHKLLGYNLMDGCFEKNRDNPLDADAVIIDETSMIDTVLMHHLLEAVPVTSALILVGDIFQLPAVGPGNVLTDMIRSEAITTFELKKIFRQAQESPIIINAHKVRRGELPDFNPPLKTDELSEFYFIEQNDPAKIVSIIAELCSIRIPKVFDHIDEIQVLTPMHRGDVGTINLNQVLQKVLNPNPQSIETRSGTFKTGDKVMHLKNNYQKEVFNGDIGVIGAIDKTQNELTVDYEGRKVVYEFSELDELSLAYAISVHKSQGSEYSAVIVPIMTQHFPLLQRNLLYTAITRGKDLVILIGTKQAMTIALKNDKPRQRLSSLAYRLSNP